MPLLKIAGSFWSHHLYLTFKHVYTTRITCKNSGILTRALRVFRCFGQKRNLTRKRKSWWTARSLPTRGIYSHRSLVVLRTFAKTARLSLKVFLSWDSNMSRLCLGSASTVCCRYPQAASLQHLQLKNALWAHFICSDFHSLPPATSQFYRLKLGQILCVETASSCTHSYTFMVEGRKACPTLQEDERGRGGGGGPFYPFLFLQRYERNGFSRKGLPGT